MLVGQPRRCASVMEEVKRQFDPKDLLNPGRFVYAEICEANDEKADHADAIA